MADIAQLGIAVDSSQVKAGSDQLRAFESVARKTGETVDQVQARFAVATKNFASAGVEAGRTGSALATLAQQHAKVAAATDKVANSTGLARHEMINLSRQAQDVAVSLGSGQSPFTVLLQQGTQIADIFGSSKTATVGGAMKQVGSAIANFLTPMRVLGLSVAATGAAAYAAYSSWKSYATQLDDVSRVAGATTKDLQGLTSAAGFKGISSDDFFTTFRRFADSTYDAKNNMGQLGLILRANGQTVGTTQQNFEKLADIIKNARDDQQRISLLQQAGLPTTRQWLDLMSQGSAGIRQAAAEATKLGDGTASLVAKAKEWDETWNRATTNASLYFKSWGQTALDWVTKVVSKSAEFAKNAAAGASGGTPTPDKPATFAERFAPAVGSMKQVDRTVVDPTVLQRQMQLEQQRIGLLGQTASVGDQVRAVELQIAQARLNGVRITGAEADNLKRLAREQALGITYIKASTDAYQAELATIGMSSGAAQAYMAVQNAINDAKRNGRVLTQDNIAAIEREAKAMGRAAEAVENVRFQYDTFKSSFVSFGQYLRNGESAWSAFKHAGVDALGKIADKLMSMAADNLWTSAFGGKGGGGILSLFGIGGGGAAQGPMPDGSVIPSANGNIFAGNVVPFARGGVVSRPHVFPMANGGIGLMGEAGPEAIIPLKRGPDGRLGVSGAGGGSGVTVHAGDTHITVQGSADKETLAQMKQELAKRDAAFASRVEVAVKSAQRGRRL